MTVASSMPSPNRWNPSASERSVAAWKNLRESAREKQYVCHSGRNGWITQQQHENVICTQAQHNILTHIVSQIDWVPWRTPNARDHRFGTINPFLTLFSALEAHTHCVLARTNSALYSRLFIINFSCCFGRPCRLEISTQSDYWDNANAIHSMSKQRKKKNYWKNRRIFCAIHRPLLVLY